MYVFMESSLFLSSVPKATAKQKKNPGQHLGLFDKADCYNLK